MTASETASRPTTRRGMGTTDIALIATFAAVIAVCAVSGAIPFGASGTPLTLQLFAVLLAGAVLGAVRGFLAVALYLAVGLAGLPIFAEGASGFAPFSGSTAGYLIAFPVAAAIVGLAAEQAKRRTGAITVGVILAGAIVAEVVVTMSGAVSWAIVLELSYREALWAAIAYVPADLVKIVVAAYVAAAVHRAFPQLIRTRR
jgi:biotin transport system substrate-specific component